MSVSKSQANLVSLLGGSTIDRVQITSPVSITAISAATANTVITSTAVVYDGTTDIVLEFFCPSWSSPAGNISMNVVFYEDSTQLGLAQSTGPDATNALRSIVTASRRLTPSAGTHTYSVRAYVDSGTGSVNAGAGGAAQYAPAYFKIVRESSLIGSTGMANVQGGFAPLGSDLGLIQSYTPTWGSSGTQPTLSNGTIVGYYQRIADKLYWFSILLTYGSSSSPGTGNYSFTLPFTLKSTIEQTVAGQLRDSGTARYPATCVLTAGGTAISQIWIATSTVWATTTPITLATGDTFQAEGVVATD